MIFCVDSKEATQLDLFLTANSVNTLLIHEGMGVTKIDEIKKDWTKYLAGMYPVIICTDHVLSELEIADIEFLIHYSITNTSKTQFDRRFSVLMDNWLLELKTKCKVLILFDETKESMHFKGIVDILKRLDVKLPDDWDELANALDLKNDMNKKNFLLCNFVKSFGTCQMNSCPFRHRIIAEVDAPATSIAIGDELKLQVLCVHSASHLSARVIERIRENAATGKKETECFPYNIIQLSTMIKKYFSDHRNRRAQREVAVGTICAYKSPENIFSRVQILNITERDIRNDPRIVKLRYIDEGRVSEKTYAGDLFEIPEELIQLKIPVIDVFLTNVAPFDEEYKWTEMAIEHSKHWLKKNTGATSFVHAKVLLHLGDSVWTDSLVVHSKMRGYKDLVSNSLSNTIKDKEFGTDNKEHLSKMMQLCISGGLTEINGTKIELPADEDKKDTSLEECE